MLQKVLLRLSQPRLSTCRYLCLRCSTIAHAYHVAAIQVNDDVVADLAVIQLDLDSVEAMARPIVDLDQIATNVGRRQATERYQNP